MFRITKKNRVKQYNDSLLSSNWLTELRIITGKIGIQADFLWIKMASFTVLFSIKSGLWPWLPPWLLLAGWDVYPTILIKPSRWGEVWWWWSNQGFSSCREISKKILLRLLLALNFFEWELKIINIHFCYVPVTRILFSTSQDFERFAGWMTW